MLNHAAISLFWLAAAASSPPAQANCEWESSPISTASKLVSQATIEGIPESASLLTLVELLGPAKRDLGSGVYILEWGTLEGGTLVARANSPCQVAQVNIRKPSARVPRGGT